MSIPLNSNERSQAQRLAPQLSFEPFDRFDLRSPSLPAEFFSPGSEWTAEHLQQLRIIPLDDLNIHRVIPQAYLPSGDDRELSELCKEIQSSYSGGPAGGVVHALRVALAEMERKGWRGERHSGEAIFSGFCNAVEDATSNEFIEHFELVHMSGPLRALRWLMAGSEYAWSALSHGQTYLSSVALGEQIAAPIITQAVYTSNNAAQQTAIMLAGIAQHLELAQENSDKSGYLAQDAFQLTLENATQLRFNHLHVTAQYLHDIIDDEHDPVVPDTMYLRRSVPFDLATVEGTQGAVSAMLGLRRYLWSGKAFVEALDHVMYDGM
ncbi:hypothetical protein BCR35DRAFT_335029 [Leucosporidium creatinivorum]|uniref:Uncharacterized protein n=1 Tax=Leucosporidium creatinivorum TaxID=106004 RepID=A0A1Y2DM73_9BASI|nr:hypothetical protein BCR35DRAFT_335029 [Leucosporidium creatinivorum]